MYYQLSLPSSVPWPVLYSWEFRFVKTWCQEAPSEITSCASFLALRQGFSEPRARLSSAGLKPGCILLQKWRQEFVPHGYIRDEDIANELAAEKLYLQGFDKLGRPLSLTMVRKHDGKAMKKILSYCQQKAVYRQAQDSTALVHGSH